MENTSVVANPLFRRLWFGQIFSQLAGNMLLFLLVLSVYEKTGSNAAVSGLFLAYGIPAVLFGMVAGVIVDHVDKRSVLVGADLLRAVLVILLVLVSWHVGIVYLVLFTSAIISQFYVPAEAPTIPRLVPTGQLVRANSLFSFTYYSSMGLGFILAGPVFGVLGFPLSLALISLLFASAAAMEWGLPSQKEGVRPIRTILQMHILFLLSRALQELQAGLRVAASSRRLLDALLLLTGTQVLLAILGSLGPGFADRVLAVDVHNASVVIVGPVVVGIVVGALWIGHSGFRLGADRLMKIGILSAGVLLIGIWAVTWVSLPWGVLPTTLTLFFLLGAANSFLDVPANSVLQQASYGHMGSRIYGLLAAAVGGLGILPVVIGGVVADIVGIGNVILLLGLVVCGYGVLRVRYNRQAR